MRLGILILFCISFFSLHAQWQKISGNVYTPIADIEYDANTGRLYAVGAMYYIGNDTLEVNGTAYRENGVWNAMGTGSNSGSGAPVNDVLVLDTAVIMTGQFSMLGSAVNTQEFAYWQNNAWHSMGVSNSWYGTSRRMELVDNQLHLLGIPDTINGQPMYNWAVYDGQNWSPGDTSDIFHPYTQDLIRYQNELVIAGNFTTPSGIRDIAKKGPNGWEQLGQGIWGDPWINEMVEYDGLLWVVGEFYEFSGNAATGLMVWDGSTWSKPFPQISGFSQGHYLKVGQDGKLYFNLPCTVVGQQGDFWIGQYDGQQLCMIRGDLSVSAYRVAVSTDTLYALGAPGPSIYTWPLNATPDTCFQMTVGQQEISEKESFEIYPNPTNGIIHLPRNLQGTIQILDSSGKLLMEMTAQNELNVSQLPVGSYMVRNVNGSSVSRTRLVVLR